MDLTRCWRAQHNGSKIEVNWTGFRFQGGWTLRLLVNGELKAEHKVRRFVRNFEVQDGPITVNFWGKMFRHRCTISAGGTVLTDSTQPWNALAFAIIFGPISLVLILALIIRASRG
jgi:hypothetical protein